MPVVQPYAVSPVSTACTVGSHWKLVATSSSVESATEGVGLGPPAQYCGGLFWQAGCGIFAPSPSCTESCTSMPILMLWATLSANVPRFSFKPAKPGNSPAQVGVDDRPLTK